MKEDLQRKSQHTKQAKKSGAIKESELHRPSHPLNVQKPKPADRTKIVYAPKNGSPTAGPSTQRQRTTENGAQNSLKTRPRRNSHASRGKEKQLFEKKKKRAKI